MLLCFMFYVLELLHTSPFCSYETTLQRCSNAFAAPEDVRQIRRGAVLTASVNDIDRRTSLVYTVHIICIYRLYIGLACMLMLR